MSDTTNRANEIMDLTMAITNLEARAMEMHGPKAAKILAKIADYKRQLAALLAE
jgi:hypothetical protein